MLAKLPSWPTKSFSRKKLSTCVACDINLLQHRRQPPPRRTIKKWVAFAIGCIAYTAWEWHGEAFDQRWRGAIAKLATAEPPEFALIKWLQTDVLRVTADGDITSDWHAGLRSRCRKGRSTYMQQAWERVWGVVRQTLPVDVRHTDPALVFAKLGSAMEAQAKHHEWIVPASVANVQ